MISRAWSSNAATGMVRQDKPVLRTPYWHSMLAIMGSASACTSHHFLNNSIGRGANEAAESPNESSSAQVCEVTRSHGVLTASRQTPREGAMSKTVTMLNCLYFYSNCWSCQLRC